MEVGVQRRMSVGRVERGAWSAIAGVQGCRGTGRLVSFLTWVPPYLALLDPSRPTLPSLGWKAQPPSQCPCWSTLEAFPASETHCRRHHDGASVCTPYGNPESCTVYLPITAPGPNSRVILCRSWLSTSLRPSSPDRRGNSPSGAANGRSSVSSHGPERLHNNMAMHAYIHGHMYTREVLSGKCEMRGLCSALRGKWPQHIQEGCDRRTHQNQCTAVCNVRPVIPQRTASIGLAARFPVGPMSAHPHLPRPPRQ